MAQTCRPAKCIEAIRVALLGECCTNPVEGAMNGYAMGCIIDADWSPEIEEGDESVLKSDCGDICYEDIRCDLVKRWNVEFKIKGPDEEFLALIGGDNLIVDAGTSVGVQHISTHCSPNLFLELFERTDDCVTGEPVYFRHVFPCVRLTWTSNEKEGIFRILQISGKSKSVLISDIADGPYNDIPAYAISAPAGSKTDYIWFEDTTIPDIQCGAIAVPAELPLGPIITSAVMNGTNMEITGTDLLLGTRLCLNNAANDPDTQICVAIPTGGPPGLFVSATNTLIVLDPTVLGNGGTLEVGGLTIDYPANGVPFSTYDFSPNVFI